MNWTPIEIKDWITTEHIRAEKERLAQGMDSCGCELCQNLIEPPQVVDVPLLAVPTTIPLPFTPNSGLFLRPSASRNQKKEKNVKK